MRFFLEISYHGASVYGWQIQKKNLSVQETIENCLSFLLKKSIKIIGAGRTDTGVHAIQMFAHFEFYEKKILLYRNLLFKLNSFLPLNIKIINIFPVKKKIHARFTAISRLYEYRISLGKNPFYLDKSWQWLSKKKIKLNHLNQGAKILKKYKDYSSFCKNKNKCNYNTYICNIYNAKWHIKNYILYFNIEANRYLRNMVRSIVGTLIELGIGKITIKDFINILYAKDRNLAGISAPAKGLFLTKINYPLNINLF